MFGSCCCPQHLWVPVPQLVDWEEGRGFITRIPKRPKQILQLGWVSNIEQFKLVEIYLVFIDSQAQIQLSLDSQKKTSVYSFANGTMIHLVIMVGRMDARRGRSVFFHTPLPDLHNLWLTPRGRPQWAACSPQKLPVDAFLPPRQNPQSSQFLLCGLSVLPASLRG